MDMGQSTRLDKLLAAKGRKRADFHVNLWNYIAIANDRKQVIDDMRHGRVLFKYRAVSENYSAHGFGAQAKAASEAAARKDNNRYAEGDSE
jgi:hypothetical protein